MAALRDSLDLDRAVTVCVVQSAQCTLNCRDPICSRQSSRVVNRHRREYVRRALDLSAAFDTIDHDILLHRLQHDFGLSGIILDWFSSYLSGRIQSVSVHSHTSVPASVSCGVPQGSALGPNLFVLYTTPLSAVIERHSILHHSYADDSQLQNSATPDRLPDLIDYIRLCIDDIKDWMTDNKLKLNDDKTEVMIISSSRMSTALSIPDTFDIGNASVPFSDTVKKLGVNLDCHLSLITHVLNLVRTANFELRRIGSIRSLLTTEATATNTGLCFHPLTS